MDYDGFLSILVDAGANGNWPMSNAWVTFAMLGLTSNSTTSFCGFSASYTSFIAMNTAALATSILNTLEPSGEHGFVKKDQFGNHVAT